MWNIEMTKHLKPIVTGNATIIPECSKWQVHLFGAKKGEGFTYRPLKGKEPNWFWRRMQYLILGNR